MNIEKIPYKCEPKYWDKWKVNDLYYSLDMGSLIKDWYVTCGEINNARECVDFCYGQIPAFKDGEVANKCLDEIKKTIEKYMEMR